MASDLVEKPPFGPPMDISGAPTWVMVDRLFALHRLPDPPFRLRDELVVALEWAQFGYSVRDAAAHIETLQRRVEELEAALESGQGFANQVSSVVDKLQGQAYSSTVSALNQFDADLRRARAALIQEQKKDG